VTGAPLPDVSDMVLTVVVFFFCCTYTAREPTFEERMMAESERREGLLAVYKQNLIKYQGDEPMLSKVRMDHDLQLKEWADWDETQRLIIQSMAQVSRE